MHRDISFAVKMISLVHARRRGWILRPSDRPHSPEHVRLMGTELPELNPARVAEFRKEIDRATVEEIPDFLPVTVRVLVGLQDPVHDCVGFIDDGLR
jgi:hypothetical protein